MTEKIIKLIDEYASDYAQTIMIHNDYFPDMITAIEKLVREEAEGYADFRKQFIYKAGSKKWVSGNPNQWYMPVVA